MSNVLPNLKYSKEHEWVEVIGEDKVRIGITDYAQHSLGDIVFVEVPEVGDQVEVDESMGTVESVKAVSDVYCPVSGEVLEVNEALEDDPEIVNNAPYGEGWMVIIQLSDPSQLDELLTGEQYEALIQEEE